MIYITCSAVMIVRPVLYPHLIPAIHDPLYTHLVPGHTHFIHSGAQSVTFHSTLIQNTSYFMLYNVHTKIVEKYLMICFITCLTSGMPSWSSSLLSSSLLA